MQEESNKTKLQNNLLLDLNVNLNQILSKKELIWINRFFKSLSDVEALLLIGSRVYRKTDTDIDIIIVKNNQCDKLCIEKIKKLQTEAILEDSLIFHIILISKRMFLERIAEGDIELITALKHSIKIIKSDFISKIIVKLEKLDKCMIRRLQMNLINKSKWFSSLFSKEESYENIMKILVIIMQLIILGKGIFPDRPKQIILQMKSIFQVNSSKIPLFVHSSLDNPGLKLINIYETILKQQDGNKEQVNEIFFELDQIRRSVMERY